MIPGSHLLILSQPDFLERQLRGVIDDARPLGAVAVRRLRRWLPYRA